MMMKDILWHGQTLFKQPEVFDQAYVPESFEYRSGQLQALAEMIKPSFRGLRPGNCRILGETATGKTTSIKLVFHEAEQESKNICLAHINGSIFSNTFSIFSRIHKSLFNFEPPSSGIPIKDLYEKIFTHLEKKRQILIVAFDDASYIDDLRKVVYDLLRACEVYSVKTGIWLVGTPRDKFSLDEKSSSVFTAQNVFFPKYTEEELFNILKKRADYGFYPNVIQHSLIRKIASLSFQRDLRFGIELLRLSAFEAESRGKKNIEEKDIDTAVSKFSFTSRGERFMEKEILALLEKKDFNSGALFAELSQKHKLAYSSFYRLIENLRKRGMIEVEEKQGEEGGRTREIRLCR